MRGKKGEKKEPSSSDAWALPFIYFSIETHQMCLKRPFDKKPTSQGVAGKTKDLIIITHLSNGFRFHEKGNNSLTVCEADENNDFMSLKVFVPWYFIVIAEFKKERERKMRIIIKLTFYWEWSWENTRKYRRIPDISVIEMMRLWKACTPIRICSYSDK